jgi:hypothetical protein
VPLAKSSSSNLIRKADRYYESMQAIANQGFPVRAPLNVFETGHISQKITKALYEP